MFNNVYKYHPEWKKPEDMPDTMNGFLDVTQPYDEMPGFYNQDSDIQLYVNYPHAPTVWGEYIYNLYSFNNDGELDLILSSNDYSDIANYLSGNSGPRFHYRNT
jgi:hypothetical protein